jgi:hypothetical protein
VVDPAERARLLVEQVVVGVVAKELVALNTIDEVGVVDVPQALEAVVEGGERVALAVGQRREQTAGVVVGS